MLKLNVQTLMQNVKSVVSPEPVKMSRGVAYLYNALYIPFLTGKTVLIKDIDYSRFDMQDVFAFDQYFEKECEAQYECINGLSQLFCKAIPVSQTAKAFF